MEDEAGGGHDLPVTNERSVLLGTGVGAKEVARVNRKIDHKARYHLAGFVDGQLARFWLAQPLNDYAAGINHVGIQPRGNDLLVILRIRAVAGGKRSRALRRSRRHAWRRARSRGLRWSKGRCLRQTSERKAREQSQNCDRTFHGVTIVLELQKSR